MIFKSVVGRLWAAIVILFIIVLAALGIFLSQYFENYYIGLQEKNLTVKARHVAEIFEEEKDKQQAMEKISLILNDANAHARIASPDGLVQKCSPGMQMSPGMRLDYKDVEALKKGQVVANHKENLNLGIKMISVTVPIIKNRKVELAVQVLSPLEPVTETTNQIKKIILASAFGGIILATFLSFILSKRLSKPLVEMNKVATQMRQNNFDGKVAIISDDEVGRLGNTLNILSEELKGTLTELSNEKDQLSNILSSMTDGVITFSPMGYIIMMNPRATGLFEITDNPPIGKRLDDCCPIPEFKSIFKEVLDSGNLQAQDVNWVDQVLSVKMAPLKDELSKIRGVVCVVQDITKEHKLEKMRKDFMANISHELRNPLFLLQGYGEALLHNVADDKEKRDEVVSIIVDETMRLQRLVNDILDLANLESDKFILHKEIVPIQEIIDGISKRYTTISNEKNVGITTEIERDIPPVYLDPDKITQVFINLMDNALRFTSIGGQIIVKVSKEVGLLKVSIKDNGQGIPEDEIPYIWERFYKVEKSRNRKSGGTGLGLVIVKKIVEAHNGKVSIVSGKGMGTTVTFSIPLE